MIAREFFNISDDGTNSFKVYQVLILDKAIEFAQYHLEKAIDSILDVIPNTLSVSDYNKIRNAYPKELIK